ncbi:MAG: class I SAM-dependent methyltransferase [Patescibacteria group bacterium]|jgi:ubiquinone/menaquinone biosynthesis C-methylase UbiE
MTKKDTSWGKSADWYDKMLSSDDTFQNKVILPNLLRLMAIEKGDRVLDVGCGSGFFSREFSRAGAKLVGVDVAKELIKIAKQNVPSADFWVAPAEKMQFIKNETVDKAVFVLSLQNISDAGAAIAEVSRCLRKDGNLFLVLNHPAFRVPGGSSWGWDKENNIQYRRLDSYLSEKRSKIQMHPGKNDSEVTWSFHAPLQYYFKAFYKNGLLVERLEEWVSHRVTPAGPRKIAENRARAEFPMFLGLVLRKN